MSEKETERRLSTLPDTMTGRLFPYQREGIRCGVRSGGRCMLADEMVTAPPHPPLRVGFLQLIAFNLPSS